jgi:yeast amino acid transporter
VYGGSRKLVSLAETGYTPSLFTYVDKSGRPLWALLFVLLFGSLAYVNLTTSGDVVFNWLLALSGLSTLFTWGSICLCHVRFRKAWQVQGHSVEELPFRAMFGFWGSWAGLILSIPVLITQYYIALWPIGGMPDNPSDVAVNFFQTYLALPVVILVLRRRIRVEADDSSAGAPDQFGCESGPPFFGDRFSRALFFYWWHVFECMADRSQMLVHRRAGARAPSERAAQPLWKKTYRILFSG